MSRRRLALRLALERRWQALYWRIVAAQALDAEALAAETLHSYPILRINRQRLGAGNLFFLRDWTSGQARKVEGP